MEKRYNFANFSTATEAFTTLEQVEAILPELLSDIHVWNTYKVIHDDPQVWRIWSQLGDIRVCFHKIYPCNDPFLHPHPWPSIVKCLQGGYEQNIGIYNGLVDDIKALTPDTLDDFSASLVKQTTQIVPNSVYAMTDLRVFHSVQASDINYSLMIMGKPYFKGATRQYSRNTPIDTPLSDLEKNELFEFAQTKYC
jgi:hypothetical protein